MNFQKIEGLRKGSVNYVYEGYLFIKNKADKETTYLRCIRWRDGCKGTAFIRDGYLSLNAKCSHGPENSEVKRRKTESDIKNIAENTCTSLRQIYDENVKPDVRPFTKIVSSMAKRRVKTLPPIPKTFEEFRDALSGEKGQINGSPFYQSSLMCGKEFSILFYAEIETKDIEGVKIIHADATFKVVPLGFYQLLIVHGLFADVIVPVFYILMTSKSRSLYDAVFAKIRNNFPGFKPARCVVDFETALYSSIQFTFECEMQGCYFHYRKALWRKWVKLGMGREPCSLKWLKDLMSLPLLPPSKIDEGFQLLSPTDHTNEKTFRFYNYIEEYWIHKIPQHFLSVHGRSRRTNSEVECFHWGLLRKMHVRHPNFWVFLFRLKYIANAYAIEIKHLIDGSETRRKRSKHSLGTDRAIKDAEERLADGRLDIREFLRRVSSSTEKSFNKMQNCKMNDENENTQPHDEQAMEEIDDLVCRESDEEDFGLCSGCDNLPISVIIQPCGHMVCSDCAKLKDCKFCGRKILREQIMISFDDC